MYYRTLLCTALLASALPCAAQDSNLRGSVGANVALLSDSEVDDAGTSLDADGTAHAIRASFGTEVVSVYADRQDASHDGTIQGLDFDTDVTETRVGVGIHSSSPTLVVSGYLERYDIDADLDFGVASLKGDDDGAGVHIGFESKTSDSAAIYARAGYLNLGDADGPEFIGGVKALVSDNVNVYGEYRALRLSGDPGFVDFDLDDIRLGANFTF